MRIDLNADLGEGCGDDAALLEVVTSANVACGFHAGDPYGIATTVALAAARGVVVGAHIGYRDPAEFGRRFVDVDPVVLRAETVYQLGALDGTCRAVGTRLAYVKPHGALYHALSTHPGQAEAVVSAIAAFDRSLPLLGLPGTLVARLARRAGLRTVTEAFADRAYTPSGTLVPRDEPGAVLHDAALVAARMVALATTGRVAAVDGTPVAVTVESVCVHGDSPGAVTMARAVRAGLENAGIELAPFA